jgi:gliding motility-associated lipoprotein GldH
MFLFTKKLKLFSFLFYTSVLASSCQTIDLYERTAAMPGNEWNSKFKPQFVFTIKDTTAIYQAYIIIRHDDRYNYNNIWLNLYAQGPDGKTVQFPQIEMPLAAKEKGWLGSGMGDLFEHRIPITLDPTKFSTSKTGTYRFTLEHIMREDPLQHILNAGIRIEKKQ